METGDREWKAPKDELGIAGGEMDELTRLFALRGRDARTFWAIIRIVDSELNEDRSALGDLGNVLRSIEKGDRPIEGFHHSRNSQICS